MAKKSVHLPLELITEILLRFSHPDFGTSHFQLAASPPTNRLVFLDNFFDVPEILSIDFDASLNHDSSYSSLSLDFYLWNPSTGVKKHIPASPITIASNDHLFIMHFYGFGYDPSTDDYLVVFGSYEYTYDPTHRSVDLAIFSLRANKWKQIESGSHFPYRIIPKGVDGPKAGLLLNGVIHWLGYNYETTRYAIIAFDLKDMTMSEIALPDEFIFRVSNPSFIEFDLWVLGGLISTWNMDMNTIEIWVMQEYKVHSSWTRTFHFSSHPTQDFSPLCFTNCGDIVGTVRGGCGGLVKFNDKGKLLECHYYGNFYFQRSQMTVYTESLLSLPSGIGQALDDS
ncbi:F-box protein CPR1-like [Vicia villosa]|uniref:F-box protein CPR1-like n=1 Tax=Vicia villosa TaxID=3911 RepID=UPI00273CE70B|nr:F-box protein CPR1-like [Vicia villosa]